MSIENRQQARGRQSAIRNPQSAIFPCGVTRREFVWEMGGGFAGVALTALLSGDRFFSRHLHADEASPARQDPLSPRPQHFGARATSCIFLMMNGAPSQIDTFDYKPALQKYGGKPLPPGKKYINSGALTPD